MESIEEDLREKLEKVERVKLEEEGTKPCKNQQKLEIFK